MRIEKEQSVALVIDYQEKLVPVMNDRELLIHNSEILLKGLQALEVPMYITQQYTKGLGMTVKEITEAAGTSAYTDKISFSAFECIKDKIWDKKYVIICGIETHICVLQTVIDLKEAGYIPVIVTDCVSSRAPYNKEMGLERMKQEGAVFTTYESLLFELLKEAGTLTSKKIQALIK